jgi:hypothetical protein
MLVALLVAWCMLRVAAWPPAFDAALVAAPLAGETLPLRRGAQAAGERFAMTFERRPDVTISGRIAGPAATRAHAAARRRLLLVAMIASAQAPGSQLDHVRSAVGHSLLLAAGLARMDLPPLLATYLQGPAAPGRGVPAAAPLQAALPQHAPPYTGSRLSADAWLMVRQDTTSAVVSGRPSYGRSQAGAVVRYRLAPTSSFAPQAYLRASSALAGALEKDLVAGLSGRLVPALPLRFAAEARISETGAGTELRPAAMAVTEFLPQRLPLGMRGEAYVQAGYVGGRFATAFVDGQARVERPVVRSGETEVTAGAGAWGGAQKGAARVDIGPTAAVSFRLGEARGRVAADYRIRIAGDAEPKSGPALTLSAGF